jgi:Lrp/AsnC family leucine-responsive transcriptional regulator
MDEIDRRILAALENDARLSMRSLGRLVHLSAPSVGERVRRLEERGIIAGYGARVNRAKAGPLVVGFVEVTMKSAAHDLLAAFVSEHEGVREAYRVAGAGCYLLRVETTDHAALDALLDGLLAFANFRVSIVVATYVGAAPRPRMTFIGAGEESQFSGASSESYLREHFGKR